MTNTDIALNKSSVKWTLLSEVFIGMWIFERYNKAKTFFPIDWSNPLKRDFLSVQKKEQEAPYKGVYRGSLVDIQ